MTPSPRTAIAEFRGRADSIGRRPNMSTRHGIDTSGMDPEEHAYHEFRPQGYGHRNSWGTWELDNPDYSAYEEAAQGIEDDDASGYNWGPTPSPNQIHNPGFTERETDDWPDPDHGRE